MTSNSQREAKKAAVAAAVGNGLEWFDFLVYGIFALTISKLFFPSTNETMSLLLVFASFGVSFVMRPLGGILIGRYADKAGRKAGMMLSVSLMFVGTLLIVLVPTAASIGIAASILILLARLLQGFAAGGEFGTATAFLIEYAPNRKVFYGSWQVATQGVALLLAGLFGFILNTYLSEQALDSWGWRLPFIFALSLGPVALYIRSKMGETPEFTGITKSQAPVKETLTVHGGRLLTIVGLIAMGTVGTYIGLFMPTYATVYLHMPTSAASVSTLVIGIISTALPPFMGNLGDRIGTVKLAMIAAVGILIVTIPGFALLISSPTLWTLVVVQIVLAALTSTYFTPLPALMSAMFPVNVRTTGLSLSYNIGVTIFGGFAPLILTGVIAGTGNLFAPAIYLTGVSVVAIICLVIVRRVYREGGAPAQLVPSV